MCESGISASDKLFLCNSAKKTFLSPSLEELVNVCDLLLLWY